MNIQHEFRNVSVSVTVTVTEEGVVEVVSASQEQTLSGRGARTGAHVSMITYRVDVYRSRPIGASLLTTSPQQGFLALKGLHTGPGWAW